MPDYKYKCKFCGKNFVREINYLKHTCTQMQRDHEFRTPTGQAAWNYYTFWLKQSRRIAQGPQAFLTSRYYNAFMKFAAFAAKTKLPRPEAFIKFANSKKYAPIDWTDDRVYRQYLEYLDRAADPYSRAADSIKTIQRIAREESCEYGDVFNHITAPVLIHLLSTKQFSPWLLLHSPKFLSFVKDGVSSSDQVAIDAIIRVPFWRERFTKHPQVRKDMIKIVKTLNL